MTIMPSLLLRASLLASLAWAVPVPDKVSQGDSCPEVPYYTLEEHWLSPSLSQRFLANPQNQLFGANMVAPKLHEIGPNRIADMNANNIKIQIISHVPVPEVLSEPASCRTANDELASAIAASPAPARFRGFCILPMALPEDAAEELRRCVTANKFVGALVDAHLGNQSFYDGPAYDPLWAAVTCLDVPIYMHPTYPKLEDVTAIGTGLYAPAVEGGYTPAQAETLTLTAWGWHERTGMAFLRLYLAGVFERHPELQVVLDHMGEMVPFFLERSDFYLSRGRQKTLGSVYANNVYITTSGMFSLNPASTIVRNTARSRIMYSFDWPLASNADGAAFMSALRSSGLVSQSEFTQIAYRNAARLLNLK
ncbi:amidohydrolase [Colletotrichum musicola]|uniref:Amidohydrolase n=1 Tax=Colletotrichum musicola TaxID=2175873 RepID=A0A8H6KHH4_9PEZI|nr:amidohydrolase [Colletotrichum musicola]